MEKPQRQLISTAAYVPVSGETTTPFSQQSVVLTKQDYIALKWEANYWRAQHARLVQREAALQAQVEALEAQIRDLTQRLYGTKSEQSAASKALSKRHEVQPRKRGQQPGTPGHGRSDRSTLPVVVEVHDVSEAAKHCPQCGEALAPFPGVEGCDSIEVQVQAHIRRMQRCELTEIMRLRERRFKHLRLFPLLLKMRLIPFIMRLGRFFTLFNATGSKTGLEPHAGSNGP